MLVDELKLTLKAGHGGPGRMSFYPKQGAGPSGGNGGRGGNIYIKGTTDLLALNRYLAKPIMAAENGAAGDVFLKDGKDAQDLVLSFPIGTVLTDIQTGQQIEIKTEDEQILVCKGGIGGLGNAALRSSRRTTPMFAQPGLDGEEKRFEVILKLIADYGLIGLPNAGKSSLLNALTNAQVKVADYAFTTLEPALGVLQDNQIKKVLADIPGLIEGASTGRGLGIKFLKHIEKVGVLLHCLSATSEDFAQDYQTIRDELSKFSPELAKKSEWLILTKIDEINPNKLRSKIKELKKLNKTVLAVSILDDEAVENLKAKLLSI